MLAFSSHIGQASRRKEIKGPWKLEQRCYKKIHSQCTQRRQKTMDGTSKGVWKLRDQIARERKGATKLAILEM